MSSEAKLQHYVPCLLLKNFAFGREKQVRRRKVWVYDKWESRRYPSAIGKIAAENGYYDVATEFAAVSLEPWLADLEQSLAPIIAEIVRRESLSRVNHEQREMLAAFIGVQMMRTPQTRRSIEQIGRGLASFASQFFPEEE